MDWSYLVVGSSSRGSTIEVAHYSQDHTLHTEFVLSMCKPFVQYFFTLMKARALWPKRRF